MIASGPAATIASFDASAFSDSYESALRDLIEAKRKDKKTPRTKATGGKAPEGENVVDLMGALTGAVRFAGEP